MTAWQLAVIPAVDVLGDEAVRLEQGDFDRPSERAGDPIALVRRFADAGSPLVHLVDLAGARDGRIRPELVAAAACVAPVQASGGIRSLADAQELLAAGATRIVLGTAAFQPGALPAYVDALGERLVVAIDVRDGHVAVDGWTRTADLSAEDAAGRCASAGVARVLCTAIARDGMLDGPDLDLLGRVAAAFGGPVLAAGGIGSEEDLAALDELGLEGAIVGRALLDGRLPISVLTTA
jgi:phosphoribosylformimino-5-aminoimidazole carboxamide ribotide isomerase